MENRIIATLSASLALTLAVATPALADTKTVPPGNGEADQYTETVPGAKGNQPPDPSRDPEDVLGPGQVDDLEDEGRDGAGAAALAAATAPSGGAERGGESSGGGDSGGKGSGGDETDRGDGSPNAGDAVIAAADPAAPPEEGLGSGLWVILAAAAVAALAFALGRRRHRDA